MESEDLQKQIDDLKTEIELLKAGTTIPFDTEQAFRERLKIDDLALLESSAKTLSDVFQAVDEGGGATYNVAKEPDGIRQWVVGGTTLYIPYYT